MKQRPTLVKQKSNRDIFSSSISEAKGKPMLKRAQSQPVLTRNNPPPQPAHSNKPCNNGKENQLGNPAKPGIFSNLRIFLVPRGIGKVQYGILKKNIEDKGGIAQTSLLQNTDCVITKMNYEDLIAHLKLDSTNTVRLHSLEWLTESLRRGKCLPKEDFRLYNLSPSVTSLSPPLSSHSYAPRVTHSSPIQDRSNNKSFKEVDKSPLAFKWRPDSNDEDSSDTEEDDSLIETFKGQQQAQKLAKEGMQPHKKPSPIPNLTLSLASPTKSYKRKRESPQKGQPSRFTPHKSTTSTTTSTTTTTRTASFATKEISSTCDIFSMQNDWLSFEEDETEFKEEEVTTTTTTTSSVHTNKPSGKTQENGNDDDADETVNDDESVSFHLDDSSLDLSSSSNSSPQATDNPKDNNLLLQSPSPLSSLSLPTSSPSASPLVHISTIHSPMAVTPNSSPPHSKKAAEQQHLFLNIFESSQADLMDTDMFFSDLEEESETENGDGEGEEKAKKKPKWDWHKGDPRDDPYFAPLFAHSKEKKKDKDAMDKGKEKIKQGERGVATLLLDKEITSSSSLSTTPPTTPPDSPPREIYTQLKEELGGRSPFASSPSSSYDTDKEKRQEEERKRDRKRKRNEEDTTRTPPKGENETIKKSNTLLVPNTPRVKNWSKKFACQQPSTDPPPRVNHNKAITDILEVMLHKSESTGDKWRAFAYRKAVNALKAYPKQITSAEQAKNVRGIGGRIAEKIGEILATGSLRKAEATDEMTEAMTIFSKIWGAGVETCKKWYAKGYRRLEDLKEDDLTKSQAIGLKYYYEFQQRIPREEVRELEKQVKEAARRISPYLKVVACGSYRRGKPDCGDIDCLITHKKGGDLDGLLFQILENLKSVGFITDDLTSVKKGDVYMGVCQLTPESVHRRIDLRLIPRTNWPFALLYFTGSDHFNRSMRLWARKHGMSLNEKGLHRRYTNDVKGEPFPGIKTEEEVFKALGLDYVPPHKRDV